MICTGCDIHPPDDREVHSVSQERGNVPNMADQTCANGVKAALHVGDRALSLECSGTGSRLCNGPVNPVTARVFEPCVGRVRSGQHCTAQDRDWPATYRCEVMKANLRTICAQNAGNGREKPVTTVTPWSRVSRTISLQYTTKAHCWTVVASKCGPPGSRSRHLGIKSPLLYLMS